MKVSEQNVVVETVFPLILECCRSQPDAGEVRRLAATCVDWNLLTETASQHRVFCLVFWNLNRTCPDLMPTRVLDDFKDRLRRDTKTNLVLTEELLSLLRLLRAANIQVVPFKGPIAAWSLYEAPGLREMSDIDVLIPEPDMERAVHVLALHGYRCAIPDVEIASFATGGQLPLIGPGGSDHAAFLSSGLVANGELHLIGPGGRAAIDLHWRLSPRYFPGPDPDEFRGRLISLEVAGQEVPAFCPEDMLLYLCAHSGKHTWDSLSMVCDVARVIDLFRLDWDAVWSRASQRHMLRAVSLGICLAKGLLRACVPDVVWDRAAVEGAPMYDSVRKRLEDNTKVKPLKFWLQLLETPTDWLRMARVVFEPNATDWESLHLPWAFRHVYYFTRPFRLAWNWGFRRRA